MQNNYMIENKKACKKVFLELVLFLAFLFFVSPSSIFAASKPELNIIIDSSGSMGQKIEGAKTKIDIAKETVSTLVDSLPNDSYVGLRAYGSQYAESVKNCTDTRQLVPISVLNKTEIKNQVNKLNPNGWTLMAYSLQKAYEDFLSPESERVIVLISDGEETCGGNLCTVAKDLEAKGVKLTVNTIGFSVNQTAKSQLTCVAEATGGKYYDVTNTAQLNTSLADATSKIRNAIAYTTEGQKITGGSGFETATPIAIDKQYLMDIVPDENLFLLLTVPDGRVVSDVSLTAQADNACFLNLKGSSYLGNREPNYNLNQIGITLKDSQFVDTAVMKSYDSSYYKKEISNYFQTNHTLYLKISSLLVSENKGCNKLAQVTIKANSADIEEFIKPTENNKATSPNNLTNKPTDGQTPTQQTANNNNGWKWALGLLGLAVVAVGSYLLGKHKNSNLPPPPSGSPDKN